MRSRPDAQERIVLGCEQLKKRSASLQWFAKIDARALAVAIANDKKNNAPNVPVEAFWEGLLKFIKDDGVPPLNCLLAFLNEIDGDSDRIERSLWTLQLVPDSRILTNKINVSDRIRLNRDVVEQLGSMDDSVRKKMTASLEHFSADEKSTYRKLLQFFRDGEFECLKGLDLDSVISIITKTKTSSGTPPADSNSSGDASAPGKLPNPTSVVRDALDGMLSGDEASKDRLEDFGSDLIKFVQEHEDPFEDTTSEDQPTIEDPKSGSTIAFPLVKIDRNLYKLVRRCTSEETWGGVVLGEYSNLHDAIADADTICTSTDILTPFVPCEDRINPFFAKEASLKTILQRIEDELKKRKVETTLASKFARVVELRKGAMLYIDAFLRYGHLAVFASCPAAVTSINEYVAAWKALFDEFKRIQEHMQSIGEKIYESVARCFLSLDVLFFRIQDNWKAIMLPSNPLFLWIYSEVYGQVHGSDYDLSDKESRIQFLAALKDLPNLINFQLVPREVYALADSGANSDYILPCSGLQGLLPTFENKTNRYLGSDGMECISDTIDRYLAFAPYAGNDLRICMVDVPDVMESVKIVSKCLLGINADRPVPASVSLEVFLTESHSGGRELEDLDFVKQDAIITDQIQSGSLNIKVSPCKNAAEVTSILANDPVHLAFFFDQSTYQVSYGANSRELYITPLVVTYDFKYDSIEKEGEIYPNTDTENGFLGSYYGVLYRAGSNCTQSQVPRTSYLKTAELTQILQVVDDHYAQWLIVADRVVYDYVPHDGLPIGVKNFGRRNVCIWANKESRVIKQFMLLLREYNLSPRKDVLVRLFNRFGHISGEGLVGIPVKQAGTSEQAKSRRKGMLGTVFAAKWYSEKYPGSLIASLDSDESRTWLSRVDMETEDNSRADLVGFRFDRLANSVVIDVIEVKTRSENGKAFSISSVGGKTLIHGHAADQVAKVIRRLKQVFDFDSQEHHNMFVSARRETLKYQIVNECFRSKYLSQEEIQQWAIRLREIFSDMCPVQVSGVIVHVDLENNSKDLPESTGIYGGENEFDLCIVPLTAKRIQRQIFGDPNEPSKSDSEPTNSIPSVQLDATNEPIQAVESQTEEIENASSSLDQPLYAVRESALDAGSNIIDHVSSVAVNSGEASSKNKPDVEHLENLVHGFWQSCKSFGIAISQCNVSDIKIGPSVIRLFITLQPGQKIETLRKELPNIGRQIARTDLRIQQVPNSEQIAVDVVRPNREFIEFSSVIQNFPYLTGIEQMPLLIGRTPEGEDVIGYLNQMPHLLVGGTTGSGKTVFLSTVLLSLLITHPSESDLSLLIVSTKPEDFISFEGIPHLISGQILQNAVTAAHFIQNDIFQISEQRQQKFLEARVSNISIYNEKMRKQNKPELPPVVVFVDEYADLVDSLPGKNERDTFLKVLRQIAQTGRSRGIHLILCTQRPSSKLLDTNIRAQLPGRVALTVADAPTSKMILEESDAGAEKLQGRGDLLFKDGTNQQLVRAQGFSLPLADLPDYVEKLLKKHHCSRRARTNITI